MNFSKIARIIPDIEKNNTSKKLLSLTGILTHDDITAKSFRAFKVKYEYHQEVYVILEKYYGKKI